MKKTTYSRLPLKGFQVTLLMSILLYTLGLGNSLPLAQAAPPSHDLFVNAKAIPGIPYTDIVNTTEATPATEAAALITDEPKVLVPCDGHPNLQAGIATVWYKYTPTKNVEVHADTMGSNYDTYIAVWTGSSLGNLTLVACDDDQFGYVQSQVIFNATAGTTYYIQVAEYNGEISATSASKPAPEVQAQGGGNLAFHLTTFGDAPSHYWAWSFIEGLAISGVTSGCSTLPLNYCAENPVTRAQMAVFLLKSLHGTSYTPPAVGTSTGFTDVPTTYWAAAWIKQLAAEGITGGCSTNPPNYCPENSVTRAQMSVFLLKSKYGQNYLPPPVGTSTGFGDVPTNYWAAAWIKQLAAEGITGGCGAGNYCPENPVTRAQMAVFLVRTFSLP